MDIYQHDSATMFQFVLRGELIGDRVRDLEHAWNTATSILAGKELVVDIAGITNANPPRALPNTSRPRSLSPPSWFKMVANGSKDQHHQPA